MCEISEAGLCKSAVWLRLSEQVRLRVSSVEGFRIKVRTKGQLKVIQGVFVAVCHLNSTLQHRHSDYLPGENELSAQVGSYLLRKQREA